MVCVSKNNNFICISSKDVLRALTIDYNFILIFMDCFLKSSNFIKRQKRVGIINIDIISLLSVSEQNLVKLPKFHQF